MATIADRETSLADTVPRSGEARLPVGVCASYGSGTIGTAVLLNTVTTYFPAFMSTVLGQSPALAGLLLTLSKAYDAVIDLVIGVRSDRRRAAGRSSDLLIGALLGGVAFMLLFAPLATSGVALVVVMTILLLAYSTGYSLFNVPYVAMAPQIARGYDNRTQLMSYRTFFSSVGQLVALAGAAALIKWGGGGAGGYLLMGVVLGVVIIGSELATFFGARGTREAAGSPQARIGFKAGLASLLRNRPGVLLLSAKSLQFISLACGVSTGLLFRLNVLQIGYGGQIQITVVQNVVMALSMPAWLWAGRRWGKKNCYLAAILLYAAVTLSWMLTARGITLPAILWRAAGQGIGAGGMILMSLSMLPDVMQHDFRISGQRREGIYSSIYSVAEKAGFALGPGLMGLYLAAAGYRPTMRGELIAQSPGTVRALYVGNAVIPAMLLVGSFIVMWFYDLDRRQVRLGIADPIEDAAP